MVTFRAVDSVVDFGGLREALGFCACGYVFEVLETRG